MRCLRRGHALAEPKSAEDGFQPLRGTRRALRAPITPGGQTVLDERRQPTAKEWRSWCDTETEGSASAGSTGEADDFAGVRLRRQADLRKP
ncbi:hypothetical protein FVA77_09255 [Phyllobacterium endophyticum]|nr:hypothetical protein FVA77_09255 [Phyllobacterium endophyticum]